MRNKSKRDEKQEFLDEIISSKRVPSRFELMQMYRMEKDKDSCIRWSLAKALVNRYAPESEAMLRRMACDKDGLVRIEAIDSLCIGREEATLPLLRRKMRQADDYLERGYAVLSYFDVWMNRYGYHKESMSRYLKSVEGLYAQEEHLWVLAMYERNRYFAGEKEALQKLKAILLDKGINDYYVLRAVISIMEEMMNIFNKDKIKEILKEFLDREPAGLQGVKAEAEKVLESEAIVGVLFLDNKNTGLSQVLESIGNFRMDDMQILFASAGIMPGAEIESEVVELMKQREGVDLREEQYPKPVMNAHWYDFIVSVGIKICEEDYSFQRIIHMFENTDETMLDMVSAEQMVGKVADYIWDTYSKYLGK